MEEEYINKNYLLQKLSRMISYCEKDGKVNGLTALFQVGDAIIDCPTIEIVRCKDCIYSENGNCTKGEGYDDTQYNPEYFCADGLRKEEN